MLVCSADTPKALHICALRRLPSLGADFLARDFDGNQAFHYRALAATTLYGPDDKLFEHTMIITMLGCGADINVRNNAGETPLFLAARGLHVYLVEIYLQIGATAISARLLQKLRKFHQALLSQHSHTSVYSGASRKILSLLISGRKECGVKVVKAAEREVHEQDTPPETSRTVSRPEPAVETLTCSEEETAWLLPKSDTEGMPQTPAKFTADRS